jgi:hypothetical protein
MILHLREERSRLAGWSAYLAVLSIPILLIAAIGHRARMIEATTTYTIIALGFGIAGLAVIAAAASFVTIWRDGRKGTGAAVRGFVVGLLVLLLPLVGAWQVVTYPRLTDISTDLDNPPRFTRAMADRGPGDEVIVDPDDYQASLQKQAYPDIVPRHYPVSTARVYLEAKALVTSRGWQILAAEEPSEESSTGFIEAVAVTLLFAFRQDVAIRIVPDGDGSLVDMRSTARNADHDLGSNADRIRQFFTDLDAALQGEDSSQ